MHNKSDVIHLMPKFIKMVQNQFNSFIKSVRTYNAPELLFKDLFDSYGILHQFSCVNTPQQNAIVERKHQHLLAVARSLYFQSQIPLEFWNECVLTATYLINRTYSFYLA